MTSTQISTAQTTRPNGLPQEHDAFELFEASHAVYVRIAGRGDSAYGPAIIDILERTLARGGRMSAYFDFEHMESYDGVLREQVQA